MTTTLHPQAPPDAQAELDELYGRFMAAMNQDDEAGAMAWEAYETARDDAIDTCDICGCHAVCSPMTVSYDKLLVDMLLCDFCRLSVALCRARHKMAEMVRMLLGEQDE